MAETPKIEPNKLISKLGFVAYFNNRVYEQIKANVGDIYQGGQSNVTLQSDVITNVKFASTADKNVGKYSSDGSTKISIKARPQFSSTGYQGSNTSTGSAWISAPVALPVDTTDGLTSGKDGNGEPMHLKKLSANTREYFTITTADVDAKATTYWTAQGQAQGLSGNALTTYVNNMKNVITAEIIYSCCFEVIRKLISIRPFQASWQHDSSVTNRKINEKFNGGSYAYGIFIDNPLKKSTWEKNTGTGTWNAGGALTRWQITLGGSIDKLQLTETSVNRTGVYAGSKATALNTTSMVENFWTAWSDRCKAHNSFDYKFFSCHLNCHSSCHSSCHGSRSRR